MAPSKLVLPLIVCMFAFIGCDTPVQYAFVAENSTSRDIILSFSTPQTRKALTIRPHQSAILTSTTEITSTRDDYFKDGLHVFQIIELRQQSVVSSRQISERKFWKLTWIKADQAVYTVNIGPAFFD